jgi:hypothetical protein
LSVEIAISVKGRQGDGPAAGHRRAVDAPPEGGQRKPYFSGSSPVNPPITCPISFSVDPSCRDMIVLSAGLGDRNLSEMRIVVCLIFGPVVVLVRQERGADLRFDAATDVGGAFVRDDTRRMTFSIFSDADFAFR